MWERIKYFCARKALCEIGYIILYGLFLILIAWWAYPIARLYYKRKDKKTIQHDKEYKEKFENVATI